MEIFLQINYFLLSLFPVKIATRTLSVYRPHWCPPAWDNSHVAYHFLHNQCGHTVETLFRGLENEVIGQNRGHENIRHISSLYVHNWFLRCKVDDKRDISNIVQWPWKWDQRSNLRSWEYSAYAISYMSTIDSSALELIVSEILAILSSDLENEVKGQIWGLENIRYISFPICPQLIPKL